MPTRIAKSRIRRAALANRRQPRKSVEDLNDPKETQDPAPKRDTSQRKDTENPPNENIRKHPDEVYGDTEIPSTHRG